MTLIPRLDQRQSQSLVMTPQLQQAIKLLQMSNLELAGYVEDELGKNPLLERDEGDRGEDSDANYNDGRDRDNYPDEQTTPDPENLDPINFDSKLDDVEIPNEAGYDLDYDNIYDNSIENTGSTTNISDSGKLTSGASALTGSTGIFDANATGIEETISEQATLREHLLDQLHMDLTDPIDRMIGIHLIGMLDESGYLSDDLSEISCTLGCSLSRVEDTLARVQDFEPAGIFARDLGECLSLQLREKDRFDPAMEKLVGHLDLVAKREYTILSKLCGVDTDDIVDMVNELRDLNPKPGTDFEYEHVQPVTPDVFLRTQSRGGWNLELNNENLPRVLVNNQYFTQISKATIDKAEREYLNEQYQTANWLVKAMHQRANTILKVATEIVRQQDEFFRKGVQYLKPLVLRDIADVIEMHESTVSRVTANKYISTPRGIFELKYFFTSAIASSTGGGSISAESVRQKIKELIESEDTKKIFSDDKLAEILKKEGMDVARRTVAKYRESLGLGSSVQRRRQKSAPK